MAMYFLYAVGLLGWVLSANIMDGTCTSPCESDLLYKESRAILCLNSLLLFTRLLFLGYAQQDMGTLILILREMTVDFINISSLIIIFLLGYGVALVGLVVDPDVFQVNNLFSIFYYPYFQIFGELNMDDLTNTTITVNENEQPLYLSMDETPIDFTRTTTLFLIAIYMLVVAIGFVNLLIAMFSDTYRKIKVNII